MEVYVITIAPEACGAFVYPKAFRSMEDAQRVLREEYNNPSERSYAVYRDSDYTYYYIDKLEVF